MKTKKMVMVVFAIATVLGIGIGLSVVYLDQTRIDQAETKYQNETPAEVKAQHLATQEKILQLSPGDFILMYDTRNNFDGKRIYAVRNNPRYDGGAVYLERFKVSGVTTISALELSRKWDVEIVKAGDDSWPIIAHAYFGSGIVSSSLGAYVDAFFDRLPEEAWQP